MNNNTETVNDELNKNLPRLPENYRWRVVAKPGYSLLTLILDKKVEGLFYRWLSNSSWEAIDSESFNPEIDYGVYSLKSCANMLYNRHLKIQSNPLIGVSKV